MCQAFALLQLEAKHLLQTVAGAQLLHQGGREGGHFAVLGDEGPTRATLQAGACSAEHRGILTVHP